MSVIKCPVCDGTRLVSRPPWIAGDVMMWTDSQTGPYTCKTCNGNGIIDTTLFMFAGNWPGPCPLFKQIYLEKNEAGEMEAPTE